jgi:hypothetical protein
MQPSWCSFSKRWHKAGRRHTHGNYDGACILLVSGASTVPQVSNPTWKVTACLLWGSWTAHVCLHAPRICSHAWLAAESVADEESRQFLGRHTTKLQQPGHVLRSPACVAL